MRWRTVLGRTVLVMLALFVAIQLVPYGWTRSNPPVTQAAAWSDPGAEELARVACYDCHSNETDWPPYSFVAPMSWLVRRDVEAGRDALNLSELDQDGGDELGDAADTIEDGSMPPRQYKLLHPAARLSVAERRQLIVAFDRLDEGEDDRGGDEDDSGPG